MLTEDTGESMALGLATRTEISADSADALWRPCIEHRLTVQLAGADLESALDALLGQWDAHMASMDTAQDWDSAAVVRRPSRDSAGSCALLRHGFAPMRVIAARPEDRLPAGPPVTPGVHVRPAERADLATATRLQLELRRYDADFGIVTARHDEQQIITRETEALLDRDEPTLWIAELYGRPLGMVALQLPPDSDWMHPYVAGNRVGYLVSLNVAEPARSSGVGTALAAHAHQVFNQARVDVVLLHHALANPRSTPFWYAQGYRPLWTYWYRRPARR